MYRWLCTDNNSFKERLGPIQFMSEVAVTGTISCPSKGKLHIIKSRTWFQGYSIWEHGTIIWTGITCKKTPCFLTCCYMRDSACRWCFLKKAEILWSCVKHFWILAGTRTYRALICLCKQFFLICPTIFLAWHNKMNLVPF